MHKNWNKTDFLEKWTNQTAKRNLNDLSICPILSWNNKKLKEHTDAVMELDGAKMVIGGKPLSTPNSIPSIYGSW